MSDYNAPPPSYLASGSSSRAPAYTAQQADAVSQNDVVAQLRAQADAAEAAATATVKANKKHYRVISSGYLSFRDAADSAIRLFTHTATEETIHDHLLAGQDFAPWKTKATGSPTAEEDAFRRTADDIRVSAFQAIVLSRQRTPSRFPKRESKRGSSFWLCGKSAPYSEMTDKAKSRRANLVSHVSETLIPDTPSGPPPTYGTTAATASR